MHKVSLQTTTTIQTHEISSFQNNWVALKRAFGLINSDNLILL